MTDGFAARHVLLADGTGARIRPVTPADREPLVSLHEQASDRSIYLRFFSANRAYAASFVDTLVAAPPTCWSLVAERRGRIVGVVTASAVAPGTAEVAMLVDEHLHGVGIATALVEQIADWSRERGVDRFTADVLTENLPMLRVFHDLGFELVEQREHDVVSLEMDLRPSPESVAARDARLRHAEARSLRPLVDPRSVAVLGVSRGRGGIGRELLENLLAGGYAGPVVALGRDGLEVPGATCVSRLEDLPDDLDLVVVALPGPEVEAAVAHVARHGARCAVVVTSGLAETGAEGRATEERMVAEARRHGTRVIGPNCFGVASTLGDSLLDATFGRARPQPGGLAVGSQSGGVGIALLEAAHRRGTGIACFVSLGNKADVSGNDLLAAWTDEPAIRTGALYLESFHDPRTFARVAATFSRRKPLLVVYGGSSAAGTRAGASHTAAHATPARALRALFRAAGVVEVSGPRDLVDTAALLTEQPLPRGSRLGIVANAGGLGILAADTAQRAGLDVPELSPDARSALAAAVPGVAGTANPVDLGAAAGPDGFGQAVRAVLDGGEVDALLVVGAATAVTDLAGIARAVEGAATGRGVPCLTVLTGAPVPDPTATTRFSDSEDACRSLAHALHYARWRAAADEPLAVTRAPAVPETVRAPAEGWLGHAEATALLDGYGIASVATAVTADIEAAVEQAERLGYPVVVKAGSPTLVHKTESRLVHVDLRDRADVARAVAAVQAATAGGPVLVQRQVAGPELAVGIARDPRFGPLVMVASGGVRLDLWGDESFLMPPLHRADVLGALQALRTWPLLTGFRGSAARDTDAVVAVVEAVGRLALDHPEIAELDLNPVVVTEAGPVCVDAKVRVGAPDIAGPSPRAAVT